MTVEYDEEIPDDGAVLTFGKSQYADNQSSRFWIKRDPITACACGDEHTVVVAASQRVFAFGANEFGQLGLPHSRPVKRPSCVKALKSEQCELVGCGKSHTVVGTADGKLFAFGLNQDGQLGLGHTESTLAEVTAWSGHAIALDAGVAHTAALSERGRLFAWGSNAEGQCGLGDSPGACLPTLVACDETIIKLSCGYRHTAFITESYRLFTFGENECGQLGVGDVTNRHRPEMVAELESVVDVACGGQHTIALLDSGEVYAFGGGSHGQLGLGARLLTSVSPVRVPVPGPLTWEIDQVAAGHCHSALVTEDGRLLTFGDPRHGKLCAGGREEACVFSPQPATEVDHFNVKEVVLGGCQSMVLVERLSARRPGLTSPDLLTENHTDRDSAARRRRREKQMSLGRPSALPPLKGVPRGLSDRHEDAIQPDSAVRSSARSAEIQSPTTPGGPSASELGSEADTTEETKDSNDVQTTKYKGSRIGRFLSRFKRKKSAKSIAEEAAQGNPDRDRPEAAAEDVPPQEDSVSAVDNEERSGTEPSHTARSSDGAPDPGPNPDPDVALDPPDPDSVGNPGVGDAAEAGAGAEQHEDKKKKSKTCIIA